MYIYVYIYALETNFLYWEVFLVALGFQFYRFSKHFFQIMKDEYWVSFIPSAMFSCFFIFLIKKVSCKIAPMTALTFLESSSYKSKFYQLFPLDFVT